MGVWACLTFLNTCGLQLQQLRLISCGHGELGEDRPRFAWNDAVTEIEGRCCDHYADIIAVVEVIPAGESGCAIVRCFRVNAFAAEVSGNASSNDRSNKGSTFCLGGISMQPETYTNYARGSSRLPPRPKSKAPLMAFISAKSKQKAICKSQPDRKGQCSGSSADRLHANSPVSLPGIVHPWKP